MTEGAHEIACPNCAATYQVPAGAIGAKGRRLVCSVCETAWRAMPGDLRASVFVAPVVTPPAPAMADGPIGTPGWATPPAPSRADWRADQPAPQPPIPPRQAERTQAAPPPEMAPTAAQPLAPQAAVPSAERLAQMAEIRQMLAELKTPGQTGVAEAAPQRARTAPPPEPAPRPEPERTVVQPAPPEPEPEPEYADDVDPLRARLAQHGVMAKAYRADPIKNPYDRVKLIRKHDRKIRRRRLQDSTGAGAFVSGFLLIVMVSAGMTAIYILHPQLIARFPTMEKPLLDYVATIDGLRVSLAQTTNEAIEWVRARLSRN